MTDATHTIALAGKEYRWRVELFDGRQRVVGEHRRVGVERWSELRNPDRQQQLLGLTDASTEIAGGRRCA